MRVVSTVRVGEGESGRAVVMYGGSGDRDDGSRGVRVRVRVRVRVGNHRARMAVPMVGRVARERRRRWRIIVAVSKLWSGKGGGGLM